MLFRTLHKFEEGGISAQFRNYYERDPRLRFEAIKSHGLKCKACDLDFSEVYGEHGRGFIEVHHRRPLSQLKRATRVDPQTDMTVLCSNCHRMVHRQRDNVLSVEKLRSMIRR